jgi:hypothetical protein
MNVTGMQHVVINQHIDITTQIKPVKDIHDASRVIGSEFELDLTSSIGAFSNIFYSVLFEDPSDLDELIEKLTKGRDLWLENLTKQAKMNLLGR